MNKGEISTTNLVMQDVSGEVLYPCMLGELFVLLLPMIPNPTDACSLASDVILWIKAFMPLQQTRSICDCHNMEGFEVYTRHQK